MTFLGINAAQLKVNQNVFVVVVVVVAVVIVELVALNILFST